ncbi:MAG: hypothetical protein AAGA72_03185 [Pseudomonadota bacterium]
MTTDADLIKSLQAQAKEGGIDPALKEQIELSLDGAYRFNAETAKFGIAWVWLVRLPMIGCAIAAVLSVIVGLLLLITGQDISFGTRELGPFAHYDWPLWLGAALPFGVGFAFFGYMTKAMRISNETSLKMADAYNARVNNR